MGKGSQQTCETLARQYRTLLEVSESIAAHRDLRELFHELAQRLHHVVRFEHMRLLLHDPERNYQSIQCYQQALSRERDRLRLLLEVNNAVVSHLELRALFAAITPSLRKVIQHEYTSLALYDADSNRLRLHTLDFPEGKGLIHEGIRAPIDDSPGGLAFTARQPVLVNAGDLERFHSELSSS